MTCIRWGSRSSCFAHGAGCSSIMPSMRGLEGLSSSSSICELPFELSSSPSSLSELEDSEDDDEEDSVLTVAFGLKVGFTNLGGDWRGGAFEDDASEAASLSSSSSLAKALKRAITDGGQHSSSSSTSGRAKQKPSVSLVADTQIGV